MIRKVSISALLLFSLVPVLGGCASQYVVLENVAHHRLFPNGVYKHKVKLTIVSNGTSPEKKFSFDGVVQLSDESIRVVVLSFFGTTMLKINDNLKTGELQTEVFLPQIKKFEPKLRDYYSILKLVLIMSATRPDDSGKIVWTKVNDKGLPLELKTSAQDKEVSFKFENYDKADIPEEVSLTHPTFKAEIKVTGYEI